MNYTLFIIPLILLIAIYLKHSNKLPMIGYINSTQENMVNYKPDYMVKTIRNHLDNICNYFFTSLPFTG